MLELLKQPKIDFMRWGKPLLGISTLLVVVSLGVLLTRGLNLGIEFTGGTELQLKFRDTPDVGAIRSALADAGLTSQVVTTIGDPAEHEVYIRLGDISVEHEDLTSRVAHTLRGSPDSDRLDLNVADEDSLAKLLAAGPEPGQTQALAAAISEARKEGAIFHSFDEIAAVRGVSAATRNYLEAQAELGPLSIRSQSFIGPAIGHELVTKTRIAIVLSLLFMLAYIGVRFQWQWGLAAVFALVHDTVITLGLFSVFQKEMSLPVVASFLTLIGYSVNDTVVVFDRIRENLSNRAGATLADTVNLSVNQTLSRTVITSGLTWIVCLFLYIFGGAALNAFSFVLCVGVVVGTYSSIYIASPFLVLWKQLVDRGRGQGASPARPGRTARKVRSGRA